MERQGLNSSFSRKRAIGLSSGLLVAMTSLIQRGVLQHCLYVPRMQESKGYHKRFFCMLLIPNCLSLRHSQAGALSALLVSLSAGAELSRHFAQPPGCVTAAAAQKDHQMLSITQAWWWREVNRRMYLQHNVFLEYIGMFFVCFLFCLFFQFLVFYLISPLVELKKRG